MWPLTVFGKCFYAIELAYDSIMREFHLHWEVKRAWGVGNVVTVAKEESFR